MKTFLCSILLLAGKICLAQQAVYFFKTDGTEVKSRVRADYYRMVDMPEAGSKLYMVNEYFINGKQKLAGKASKISPLVFQGQVARFYPNGMKMQLANYRNNRLCGLLYDFYHNGKIQSVKQYPEHPSEDDYDNYRITDCLDSTGKTLVANGEGYYNYIGFDEIFKEEGAVKNGLHDGEWKGTDKEYKIDFTERYENGALVSGVAVGVSGKEYHYQRRYVAAHYRDGEKALYSVIQNKMNALRYGMLSNVNGTAYVRFTITPDAKIENIVVLNSTSESMDDHFTLVIASTAKGWIPASKYGIPLKSVYTLPISVKSPGVQDVFE